MIMTNKLLPVALIAALIGGSVGRVGHAQESTRRGRTTAQDRAQLHTVSNQQQLDNQTVPAEFNTATEQTGV